ncbi:MAG: pyridoxal-phosphate dependent enzyme [Gammaproteobacteria bacterium]|nr:pyridoxal-phosphate dependent enzyme [Gammaproteobacteria bacterium]
MTIADGVRTLSVSPRTFQYIKKVAGFYQITEQDIFYWTQWLTHLLKVNVEPTCALAAAGAYQWVNSGNYHKKILVIITGGNIDPATYVKIWQKNYLEETPKISA